MLPAADTGSDTRDTGRSERSGRYGGVVGGARGEGACASVHRGSRWRGSAGSCPRGRARGGRGITRPVLRLEGDLLLVRLLPLQVAKMLEVL